MKKSVSQQLLEYLQQNHGVFASGDLQRMEWRNSNGSTAVPRSVVRRLQELAEEGKINCEMRGNHAHYSAQPIERPPQYRMEIIDTPTGPVARRVLIPPNTLSGK